MTTGNANDRDKNTNGSKDLKVVFENVRQPTFSFTESAPFR